MYDDAKEDLQNMLADRVGQLKIPRVDPKNHIPHTTRDLADVKTLHAQFRWEAVRDRSSINGNGLEAEEEVTSIQKSFPAVVQANVQCAMAAWLFILCFVDDLLDRLSPDDGVTVAQQLAHSMIPMTSSPTERMRKQDALAVHFSDTSTADKSVPERLKHAVLCFREHSKIWVPDVVYDRFCTDVSEVFSAMATDIQFKNRRDRDLFAYINIRTISIGTGPFFCLLRFSMGYTRYPTPQLISLESCVSSLSALLNDIIGLEREIAAKEWMNYAIICSNYRGDLVGQGTLELEPGIRQTVEEYHLLLELAHEYWNNILEENCEEDIHVAASLLDFVAQHFHVERCSKRYM